jgi:hypothetical protein
VPRPGNRPTIKPGTKAAELRGIVVKVFDDERLTPSFGNQLVLMVDVEIAGQ